MFGALRYSGLIYHAVRLTGRGRVIASARAGRVLRRQVHCRLIGHPPSWPLAEALGVKGGPVCERCLALLGEARRDA